MTNPVGQPPALQQNCRPGHPMMRDQDEDSLEMAMRRLSDYHLRREMTQKSQKKKNKLARQNLRNQAATKKGNNSQHEQERPQGLTDIPTEGKKDIKIEKELRREYDELHAIHVIKLEKLESELNAEREKNDTLQKQLEMLKSSQEKVTKEEKESLDENIKTLTASHKATIERYEADLLAAREQADNIRHEFEQQLKEAVFKDEVMIESLMTKNNALLKNIEEMSLEQQTSAEQKSILQKEIEDQKAQLSVQSFHNKELQAAHMISLEKLETKLNVEIEMNDTLQKQLEMLKSSQEESNQRSEKVINELQKEKESCCEKIKTLTASHKATTERYEADLLAAREQANNLQYEFKSQKEKDELLIKQLTIKSNALLKNIEEMSLEQENFDEQKRILQKEIEDLKAQLSVWTIHNEELQAAHVISLEKSETKLNVEIEKNDALQKQLEIIKFTQQESNQRAEKVINELQKEKEYLSETIKTLTASHEATTERYEADLLTAREQADNLQCEFKSQKEKDELLIKDLTIKSNALLKNIEEMSLEQENCAEQKRILTKEIEDLKAQLSVRTICNQEQHSVSLEAETHNLEPEVNQPEPAGDDKEENQTPDHQTEETNISNEPQRINTSAWKRFRHFLGLRKPKRWKKKLAEAEETE